MKIIDPHIHFFDLAKGDYHWLKAENPPFWKDKAVIARNVGIDNLHLTAGKLSGFVHIEAGFDNQSPWREIAWLESMKSSINLPFRAVAAIDLTLNSVQFSKQLSQLKQFSSVIGCRHILDNEAQALLSNPDVVTNLKTLADCSFLFELQMPFSNTNAVYELNKVLSQIPKLTVIINHAGFPDHISNIWQKNLNCIAKHPNCFIKCSGWEMTNRHFDTDLVSQIIRSCITLFGLKRVMLASNFPLVLLSQPYNTLWQHYINEMSFSQEMLSALIFDNAKTIYNL